MNLNTESASRYNQLELMSVADIVKHINSEDTKVAEAVHQIMPAITTLITAIVPKMQNGGRLFYIGAGTSGRLGILDASECPPTFGVSDNTIIGLIAGGDTAIRKAVESAEDDPNQAWKDLEAFKINKNDSLVGIAASGQTPYVTGGLKKARENGLLTGCIVCNTGSPVAREAEIAIELETGPEFLTGSTRMKAGTAQKMVLNIISTALMIQLGRVKGNLMVDMKLSNKKLWSRGVRMVIQELGVSEVKALELMEKHGSVRKAINSQIL